MRRTQIYLEVAQQKALKVLAKQRSATLSELIREAVWDLIARSRPAKSDPLLDIVGLYQDESDVQGSTRHDDLYE